MEKVFQYVLLLLFITVVSYYDIRFHKIYNRINIPFLIAGILTNIWINGLDGLYLSILGIITGFCILVFPFLWGWVGGGDIKFLAAAGAFLGPQQITYSTLFGLILFGIAALIHLIRRGRVKKFFSQLGLTLFTYRHMRGVSMIEVTGRMPLGFFLGLGMIFNWIYMTFYL